MKSLPACLVFGFLLMVMGYPRQSHAQPLAFEHLTVQQGLSNNNIWCIYQDREGFMWFGTGNGLNRYDGYSVKAYKPDPNDPEHTLQHYIITDIQEDRSGQLWVSTFGGGLNLVDKRTGKVTAYGIPPLRISKWNILTSIYEDREGIFWLGSSNGFIRFDPKSRKIQAFQTPGKNPVMSISEDLTGKLWLSGRSAVYRFDPKTGSFTTVALNSIDSKPFIATSLYMDAEGVLWAGTFLVLFRVDTRLPVPTATRYNPAGVNDQGIRGFGQGLYGDRQGYLWVASSKGLQRIDTRTNQVVTFRADSAQPQSLNADNIQCIYQDSRGVFWVGTNLGINKSLSQARKFMARQIIPSSSTFYLQQNNISALLEDSGGMVWLGSAGEGVTGFYANGLYHYEDDHNRYKPFLMGLDPVLDKQIWALYEDRSGRFWVGSSRGLNLINRTTGKITRYPFDVPVQAITEDAQGQLWLTAKRSGRGYVVRFNPETRKSVYYRTDETGGLNDSNLYDILPSRNGDIYVGTGGGGINRLNPQTGKFSYYLPNSPFTPGHLTDKDIQTLYEDAEGMIWVGTGQGGLNRLDPRTGRFTLYSTQDGLPSDHIVSIIGDDKGNLWLGTDQGLCRLNPRTRQVRTYTVSDGLPANEFRRRAVYRRNGKLFFGSINGYVVFHPDSLRDNPTPPPVYLTGFKVMDKAQPIPTEPVAFAHNENFFSFEFVALNYQAPENNQYAYQLVGVDKNWVYSGTQRQVNYTDLRPGHYTFRVKASNNDGVWNEKGLSLSITVHPPWWQTWWAYGFYALCLLAGGLAFDRMQRRRLIARERERTRERELTQAREIEKAYQELQRTQAQLIQKERMIALRAQMNPHFVFNCLNSIKLYTLQNDSEKASLFLTKFAQLIRLVLENSRSEYVTLRNELDALRLYIELEAMRFKEKLRYQIVVSPEIDPQYLRIPPLLLQPFVENAIWHGLMHKPDGGTVTIEVRQPQDNLLHIEITDDGIGRARSAELKSKSADKHRSFGMQVTADRIRMINQLYNTHTHTNILDLVDSYGEPAGTKVILEIPV